MGDYMDIFKNIILGFIFISALIIIILALKTKRAFKMLFLNAFVGLSVFLLIYFTRKFSGININLNEFTFIGCSFLGIPVIIGFLIMNFII